MNPVLVLVAVPAALAAVAATLVARKVQARSNAKSPFVLDDPGLGKHLGAVVGAMEGEGDESQRMAQLMRVMRARADRTGLLVHLNSVAAAVNGADKGATPAPSKELLVAIRGDAHGDTDEETAKPPRG